MVIRGVVLACFCSLAALVAAGQEPTPEPSSPIFGTGTTAVVVDVVVRDRAGNTVIDLRNEDFELLEDAAPQRIVSFESPRGASAVRGAPGNPAPLPTPSKPIGTPRLVALVFEELGPEARAAAHKAARVYLEEQKGADEFVGVFVIDRALQTLVPYTRDLAALERAVRSAVMRPGCPLEFEGDVASAAGGSACSDGLPTRQRANATLQALATAIDALHLVPGRKSVLLFSEGIPLESESDVMDRFNAVIGRANRSGVSFYTVDAAGLRAQNPSARARRLLRQFTAEDPGSSVPADAVMFSEPYVALSRLANETGGAFLDNTNELERAARRMGEDLRAFYLLGYVPTNAALDGRYRRIDVRVKRPDVTVQARAGYLALPLRRTLAPHDVAPLLTLEQGSRPRDFRFDADVDTSRSPAQVRARVEHRVLRYVDDTESTTCQARLTILARAVAKDGRTLWLSSDAFDLSRPATQCQAAKRGATEFERTVALPPHAARVDGIAYDALAERASVTQFEVAGTRR